MISAEVKARDVMMDAIINEWKLETISTNWPGYWIVQLTRPGHQFMALLVDLESLAGVCRAISQCIDAARDPSSYPGAKTMYVTAASGLPTTASNEGSISVMSEWESIPCLTTNYYSGARGKDSVIRQSLDIEDAMKLCDLYTRIYLDFPGKERWSPRKQ